MKVTWTNTFTVDFDLDQAEDTFYILLHHCPHRNINTLVYDAVRANWVCDGEEYLDTAPAIEQCAEALRKRVCGVQMEMEIDL